MSSEENLEDSASFLMPTYTLNNMNVLQNNLGDDTLYYQDLEDGSTGWTLGGLPVLFTNDGQPILLNGFSEKETVDEDADMPFDSPSLETTDVPSNRLLPQSEINALEDASMTLKPSNSTTYDETPNANKPSFELNDDTDLTFDLIDDSDLSLPLEIANKNTISTGGNVIFWPQEQVKSNTDMKIDVGVETSECGVQTNESDIDAFLAQWADVTYKCKGCSFQIDNKQKFVSHVNGRHAQKFRSLLATKTRSSNTVAKDTEKVATPPSFLVQTDNGTIEIEADFEPISKTVANGVGSGNEVLTNSIEKDLIDVDAENFTREVIVAADTTSTGPLCQYVCSQCSELFSTLADCRHHMIKAHRLKIVDKWEQDNCEKTLDQPVNTANTVFYVNILSADKSNVAADNRNNGSNGVIESQIEPHGKRAKGTLQFKCTVRGCTFRFSTEETQNIHERCHASVAVPKDEDRTKCNYICCECKKPQRSWRSCSLHLWRTHKIDMDLLTCSICRTHKSTTHATLDDHMKIHGNVREHVCPECRKTFKQPSQLRNHRVTHLDKEVRPKWYKQKECDQCNKVFSDAKCLKKHIQAIHSKLKPFICNVCGHSCARKAMLQLHLRQHTGEKPYACPTCNYRTGDHNSLRRHQMKHTGVRPYKCPYCSYSCIQSSSYKVHLRAKHPDREGVHTCSQCPFSTVNYDTFIGHCNDHKTGLLPTVEKEQNIDNDSNSQSNENDLRYLLFTTDRNNEKTEIYTVQIAGHKSPALSDSDGPCYLQIDAPDEQCIDTGGYTIPADPVEPTFVDST